MTCFNLQNVNRVSILLILLIVSSLNCVNVYSTDLQKVKIIGRLYNLSDSDLNEIVTFHIKDIVRRENAYVVEIDSNGIFQFQFQQLYPNEVFVSFSKSELFVSSYPGDSIHIELDADVIFKRKKRHYNIREYVSFSGDNANLNNDLFLYDQIRHDSIMYNYNKKDSIKLLSAVDYKKHIERRSKVYTDYLENFNHNHNTCKEFQDYACNSIKYSSLDDLMRYRWYHPKLNNQVNKPLDLPSDYFSFLDKQDYNDVEEVKSNDYYSFIRELFNYYASGQCAMPEDSVKLLDYYRQKGDVINSMLMEFRQLSRITNGFVRDLMLATYLHFCIDNKMTDLFDCLYSQNLIINSDLNSLLMIRYQKLKEDLKDPKICSDKILKDIKSKDVNVLDSIIKSYPNKVIYIDFWAPWCGPCMNEMSFSNKLHDYFDNNNVEFIYLANRCSVESWKMTISKQDIKGKHVLLTDKQFGILSEHLGFAGIPRYLLINKEGVIVNSNAPRPSSESRIIDEIKKLIEM